MADGDIFAADLRTGKGKVVVHGDGTPSVGLKISHDGRMLYVAGGTEGTAKIIDLRRRETTTVQLTTIEPSFINDVVLTRRAAWFTNSQLAELYRVRPEDPSMSPRCR